MFYTISLKQDSVTFEAIMKHDDEDNTMKLPYNQQLRATTVITQELFRITS
jgi:hypothetical protein